MKRLSARSRCTRPRSIARPLRRVDDPRDDVERPRPVDAAAVGVDGERDAHRQDVGRRRGLAGAQLVELERVDDGQHSAAAGRGCTAVVAQLVPRLGHRCRTLRGNVAPTRLRNDRSTQASVTAHLPGLRLLGQAEDALADDVALDLAGAAPDRLRREKKNADIIGDTDSRRGARHAARPATSPSPVRCRRAVASARRCRAPAPSPAGASPTRTSCCVAPSAAIGGVVLPASCADNVRSPLMRRIWICAVVARRDAGGRVASPTAVRSRPRRRAGRTPRRSGGTRSVADWPRSNASVELATFQPLLTPPTTLSAGHRASVKNTSQNSAVPSGWVMPAHVDSGLTHRHEQVGDALVLRCVGIGARRAGSSSRRRRPWVVHTF